MSNQKQNLHRIAVGVDASNASIAALTWATGLAAESGADVTAIMSWNYPVSLLLPVVGAAVLPSDAMNASTGQALSEIVSQHPGASLVTSMTTPMGAARNVLVESSEDHDLIVIGRTGRGPVERLVLGSTASHVARHAECPVALVKNDVVPQHLTVAVDGSRHSIDALAWALGLAGSREVLAVYAHDESVLDEMPLSSEDRVAFDERAKTLLIDAVCEAARIADVDPEQVHKEVRTGDPRTAIVEAAEPDTLLVMGARGHSGLSAWMLGSLADFAIHHSTAPLIIWNSE